MDDARCADDVAELGRLLPAVFHKFHAHRRRALSCGLTPPMLALLRRLAAGKPGWTVTELAQEARLAPSTVSPMLKRLERRGLVQRQRDERDERRVVVVLTVEGRRAAQLDDGGAATAPFLQALRRLSAPEREGLLRGLRRLLEAD